MSKILVNIFQNLSHINTFYNNIYCLAISSIYAIKQRQFYLMSSQYQLYKQVDKDIKGKGKSINIVFYVNRSVKISKVGGYQLCFDTWVALQLAGFIKEHSADGHVGGVEIINLRRGCNSVVSENIPGVESLQNVPRLLETKVSTQVFSILIGNYFKRHSLNNFH